MIRRTAGEVLRNLESRVARLEARKASGMFSGKKVVFSGPSKSLSLSGVAEKLLILWRREGALGDMSLFDDADIFEAFIKARVPATTTGVIESVVAGEYGTKKAFEVALTSYVAYAEQMLTQKYILSFNARGEIAVFPQ